MISSRFAKSGSERIRNLFRPGRLAELVAQHDKQRPGTRITNSGRLSHWLHESPEVIAVLDSLGKLAARPVRAILFDKSPAANWSLGWHQDRTICVKRQIDVPGFGPFTSKAGLVHVEPPFEIIERMATLRFHIDPVDDTNAPLLVAEGSHRLGKVPVSQIDAVAAARPNLSCLAEAGDVWAYATPILHASERSRSGRRRRVLQVDFSADTLVGGLEWLGV